jgi:hypothetical protein
MTKQDKVTDILLALGYAASALDDVDEKLADHIRDMMDPLWYDLDQEHQQKIRGGRQLEDGCILEWVVGEKSKQDGVCYATDH